jgi:exodeoxyribonuclease VII small subunit
MVAVKKLSFEEAMSRLEEVVKELEDGKLPLEKALELFAKGITLSRNCSEHLVSAEQRIAILTADDKGAITLKEMEGL